MRRQRTTFRVEWKKGWSSKWNLDFNQPVYRAVCSLKNLSLLLLLFSSSLDNRRLKINRRSKNERGQNWKKSKGTKVQRPFSEQMKWYYILSSALQRAPSSRRHWLTDEQCEQNGFHSGFYASFFHPRVCSLLANVVCKHKIFKRHSRYFSLFLTLQPPAFSSDLVDNLALASLNLVSHLELASVSRK